jgi:DNA gyrase subunit A
MEIIDSESTFLVCTQNGYGKRTPFDEYRIQRRGGGGVMAIRASERNGSLVGAHAVKETDALMLITANGKMIRMAVSDVRVIGRATQGVRLINLDEGDSLVSATTIAPEDEEIDETPDDQPRTPRLAMPAPDAGDTSEASQGPPA